MSLPHLAARIFGTPLMVSPDKAQVILSAIGSRFDLNIKPPEVESSDIHAAVGHGSFQIRDGIAVIPITGTLVKRAHGLNALSGLTSYEALADQVIEAATNPSVDGILLDIDSPGGEVAGLFDLVDVMKEAKELKPMYAAASDSALSAAYAIASVADQIFVTRTGAVGSVGVIAVHVDESEANAKAGFDYTVVRAGKFKAETNPMEPLTEHAHASLQGEIDRIYGMFVDLVADNRNMSASDVSGTEAQVYHAENGVEIGLADQIGTPADAFVALSELVVNPRGAAALNSSEESMDSENDAVATADENVIDLENYKEEAKIQGKQETLAYVNEVQQLCALAGRTELAQEFIGNEVALDQVRQTLLENRAEADTATVDTAIDTAERPSTETQQAASLDVGSIYSRLNAGVVQG